MAELIPIDGLGAGIVKKADDEDKRLKSGQLSLMLQHKFGSKLRFNLLTKNIEVDGEVLSVDEFEGKHVALSEQGWEITPTACRDAISYAAKQNSYHPIREYLDWVATSDVEPFDLDHIASYLIGTNDPLYDAMIAATSLVLSLESLNLAASSTPVSSLRACRACGSHPFGGIGQSGLVLRHAPRRRKRLDLGRSPLLVL